QQLGARGDVGMLRVQQDRADRLPDGATARLRALDDGIPQRAQVFGQERGERCLAATLRAFKGNEQAGGGCRVSGVGCRVSGRFWSRRAICLIHGYRLSLVPDTRHPTPDTLSSPLRDADAAAGLSADTGGSELVLLGE